MRSLFFVLVACLWAGVSLGDDNIVVVLDTSDSMSTGMRDISTTRMEAAKAALVKVVGELPKNTNIGILTFSGWVYELGKIDVPKLTETIWAISPDGGTPLGAYTKIGADALLLKREKSHNYGTYKLFIITDGEATDGNTLRSNFADIVTRGLVIDTIGVDMAHDHFLSVGSNRYMRADDSASLEKAVHTVMGEVSSANNDTATDFEMLEGLSPEVATVIVNEITQFHNQPIGEQEMTYQLDADGNLVATPAAPPGNNTVSNFVWWTIGVILVVLLVILIVGCIGSC